MSTAARPAPELLDPATAWKALTPEQQRRIGVAAIVLMMGDIGAREADEDSPLDSGGTGGRVRWDAAYLAGNRALQEAVQELLPDAFNPEPKRPDLAALGVRACRSCGCTDECACPERCHWIAPDLCSSCGDAPSLSPIGAASSRLAPGGAEAEASGLLSSTEASAPLSRMKG